MSNFVCMEQSWIGSVVIELGLDIMVHSRTRQMLDSFYNSRNSISYETNQPLDCSTFSGFHRD